MKAIIPAAGLGTRFLPATKAQPKEMLLVVDRPVIQYIVEESLDAGFDEVVIVNARSKHAIEDHFAPDRRLEEELRLRGKADCADRVAHAGSLAVSFVYQDEAKGLGHAIACAADKVGDEPFAVLLGDVIVPSPAVLERMKRISDEHDGASVIAVMKVEHDQVSRFGIIDGVQVADDVWKVSRLVEKPAVDEAPTDLAIFGRYILSPAVMRNLKQAKPGAEGEIQLTDSIDAVLGEEEVFALTVDASEGFDTGTPLTWLTTNIALALDDPKIGPEVRRFVERQLGK